ncbi:MAG: hypothetical protein E6R07_14740 [Nevskiaceae bacterium]|nr:MAG: hypothetical protein E6R07_14740 [Nevskiaceae bacterium]
MNLRIAFAVAILLACYASESIAAPKPGKNNGRPHRGSYQSEYCYNIPASSNVSCRGLNDSGQPLGAADIVGSTIHGTTYNDERIWAAIGTSAFELKWQALQRDASKPGSFSPFPASPTPDGSVLYWTPGANSGYPNVYAVDARNGAILWSTAPWIKDPNCDYEDMSVDPLTCNNDKSTPDPWTYFVAATVDDKGNAYVGDLDQLWAFSPERPVAGYKQPLWVIDIASACGGRPWAGNAIIYRRDISSPHLLAAACTTGSFILVNIEENYQGNRILDSLHIDQNVPTECPNILGDLYWGHGEETFLRTVRESSCGALGIGLPFTETQAFDPTTATIYQAGASDEPGGGGKVYAVRIVESNGIWRLERAWTTLGAGAMGANGSTSPTIEYLTDIDPSADPFAAVVYASDESGIMYAFDTKDGSLVAKSAPGLTVGFSPQIAFNGYLTNANDNNMIALQLNLSEKTLAPVPGWGQQDWSFLLGPGFGNLNNGPTVEGLPSNITIDPAPKYTFQGVVPQYLNVMTAPPSLLYNGTLNSATFYSLFKQALVNVDPSNGSYVPNSYALAYPQRGSWMGGGCFGRWGGVCDSWRAEGRSKAWLNTVNPHLETTPPPDGGDFYAQGYAPGGLQGMVPVSPLAHARDVISFMENQMFLQAVGHWNFSRWQLMFDVVRKLPPNTTRQASALVRMALEKGEIDNSIAAQVQGHLARADAHFVSTRTRLINNGGRQAIFDDLNAGRRSLAEALALLPPAASH